MNTPYGTSQWAQLSSSAPDPACRSIRETVSPELPTPRAAGPDPHLTGSATQRPGDTSRGCRAGLVMHPSIGI
jgi:hypothetical protein